MATHTFNIHYDANKGIKVSGHGGNGEVEPGDEIEWASRTRFRLKLHKKVDGPAVNWTDVFSTPEPDWQGLTCKGTVRSDLRWPYFKYDVVIDRDNTLDPVIIVGGRQKKRFLFRVLIAIGGLILGGIVGYVLAT